MNGIMSRNFSRGLPVESLAERVRNTRTPVVISSLKRLEKMVRLLLALGIASGRIFVVNSSGDRNI